MLLMKAAIAIRSNQRFHIPRERMIKNTQTPKRYINQLRGEKEREGRAQSGMQTLL
jgi:hypothetical protein